MTITLASSESDLGSVLIAAPTTVNMVALTASAVFALYPAMTFKGECLILEERSMEPSAYGRDFHLDIKTHSTNEHWTKPCGLYCPERLRKTVDDDGIAAYPWNSHPSSADESTLRPTLAVDRKEVGYMFIEIMQWTLGRCRNEHCSNSRLRDGRMSIVR